MSYTIRKFAKLVGVSVDALRHYEQAGIVTPEIDRSNNYRLYSTYDIIPVISARVFRGMGMPVSQVAKTMESASLQEQLGWLEHETGYILQQIDYYNSLLKRNHEMQTTLQDALNLVGEIREIPLLPRVYRLPLLDQTPGEDLAYDQRLSDWMDCMPYAYVGLSVALADLTGKHPYIPCTLVLGMLERYQQEFEIDVSPPVYRLEPSKGVHTVLPTEDIFRLKRQDIETLIATVKRKGYTITSDLLGKLEAVDYSGEKPVYYLGLRICVQ